MNSKNITQEEIDKVEESGFSIIDSEQKEPIIGSYKPKRKFLNFVTGLKGRIRLLNNVAFIKGDQLSGMLEDAIFKVTICDEGTINFEEMDTNLSTPDMIQRFIDEIDSRDVTGYTQKFIVSGLEFQDEDAKVCYLEVEHKKPIDMLFSLFDESQKNEVSETGMSILDALFSSDDDLNLSEKDVEIIIDTMENSPAPNEDLKNAAQSYMEEQFRKMNEEKIAELKERIEKNEKESAKLRHEISTAESKLKKQVEDLKVLETRLDSFSTTDTFNGYVFNVSDEQKEDIGLSDENRDIADKIADIVGLKKDVLFKMLTQGYYKIRIAEKSDINTDKVKVTNEILNVMKSLVNSDESKDAKITMTEPGCFEYRGGLTWHQIVGKMIRKGFEQNEDFDKVCGSNSYESKDDKESVSENN
jgi:hypothetical protein